MSEFWRKWNAAVNNSGWLITRFDLALSGSCCLLWAWVPEWIFEFLWAPCQPKSSSSLRFYSLNHLGFNWSSKISQAICVKKGKITFQEVKHIKLLPEILFVCLLNRWVAIGKVGVRSFLWWTFNIPKQHNQSPSLPKMKLYLFLEKYQCNCRGSMHRVFKWFYGQVLI